MVATATTIRVFWKCARTGCGSTRVTDLEVLQGKPALRGADGGVFGIHDWMFIADRCRATWQTHGLVCTEHNALMKGEALTATHNPNKVCDGRCLNARRASCDCSCGGANHGGLHL